MSDVKDLTADQLRKILSIKEQIEDLHRELESVTADVEIHSPIAVEQPKKGRMSAAGRARIAAGARARWAKMRGENVSPAKKKRKVSRAVRARLAEAARQRWAKAKAAGKTTL
jgi:hypothetical protein